MPKLNPFPGLVVKPEWVEKVTTGPYDSYSPEQRAEIISENPLSFLNVTRSSEDLPEGQKNDIEQLLLECKKSMELLYENDVYQFFDTPSLFIYKIEIPYNGTSHSQTGIVGLVPVEGNENLQILRHEKVRPERSKLMSRHLVTVGASSSPISLTYQNDQYLEKAINKYTLSDPVLLTENEMMKQTVWRISGKDVDELSRLLEEKILYITDGHHRMAAAEEALRDSVENYDPLKWTQAVLFPNNEMLVLPFHRRVGDPKGRSNEELLEEINSVSEMTKVEHEVIPRHAGEIGVLLNHEWYRLTLPESRGSSLVDQLDVSILQDEILGPIFEVENPGTHKLIDYVPGPLGIDVVKERCQSDSWVGFILHPLTIDDLMAVAEAGELMPPKSSYLMPKPRSGVFVRNLERELNSY